MSPNYPQNYTSGQICLYFVTVPKDYGMDLFCVFVYVFQLLPILKRLPVAPQSHSQLHGSYWETNRAV